MIVKLPYVHETKNRHGNPAIYFWRGKGHRKIRIRETPGTAAFRAAYDAAAALDTAQAPVAAPGVKRPSVGTWGSLCRDYLSSGEFRQLGHHTTRRRRQLLEWTWDQPIAPGAKEVFRDFPLTRLTAKAIAVLRDRKADVPESANGLVTAIRQVFAWAMLPHVSKATFNPARDVPTFKSSGDGWHTWTVEEVRQYQDRHPLGTKARLAFDLLLHTGVRRSDVVTFGRQMVREGWLRWTEHKGRKRQPKARSIPILPELARSIEAARANGVCGDLTYLVTHTAGRSLATVSATGSGAAATKPA